MKSLMVISALSAALSTPVLAEKIFDEKGENWRMEYDCNHCHSDDATFDYFANQDMANRSIEDAMANYDRFAAAYFLEDFDFEGFESYKKSLPLFDSLMLLAKWGNVREAIEKPIPGKRMMNREIYESMAREVLKFYKDR